MFTSLEQVACYFCKALRILRWLQVLKNTDGWHTQLDYFLHWDASRSNDELFRRAVDLCSSGSSRIRVFDAIRDRYSKEETITTEASAEANHILIAYTGSDATSETERTKEEALALAQEMKTKKYEPKSETRIKMGDISRNDSGNQG